MAGYAKSNACGANVRPGGAWRRLIAVKLPTVGANGKNQAMHPWAVVLKQEPTEVTMCEVTHVWHRRNPLPLGSGGCQYGLNMAVSLMDSA